MSNYRRANTKGGTYFFTVVTYRRQKFLCDENALREGIMTTQATHPFNIDAWVLLPDHIHCIWTLPPDDADFGRNRRHIELFRLLLVLVILGMWSLLFSVHCFFVYIYLNNCLVHGTHPVVCVVHTIV